MSLDDDIRETIDEVFIVQGQSSTKRLHIPTDDGDVPFCADSGNGLQRGSFTRQSVASYPPGWRPWCSTCVSLWSGLSASPEETKRIAERLR